METRISETKYSVSQFWCTGNQHMRYNIPETTELLGKTQIISLY